MVVAKAIKEGDIFYKYIVSSSEITEKSAGTYIHPIFHLAYFNLLHIYKILEPEHYLLKKYDDSKRYYSHVVKDKSSFTEDREGLNRITSQITTERIPEFYNEVEVENTLLLQYLIENYGTKYLSETYMLVSRRARMYETSDVPNELSSLFSLLGISEVLYQIRYRPGFMRSNHAAVAEKLPVSLFRSISSESRVFSFAKMTARLLETFIFDSKESVTRTKIISNDFIQIPNSVNQYQSGWRPAGAPASLDQVLSYLKKEKTDFIESYERIKIKEEITDFINKKITNQNKKEIAAFFSAKKEFVYPIRFSVRSRYGPYTSRNTRDGFFEECRTGCFPQTIFLFMIEPDFISGGILSTDSLQPFNGVHSNSIIYTKENRMAEPKHIVPMMDKPEQEKSEQLSFLEEEEGAPA